MKRQLTSARVMVAALLLLTLGGITLRAQPFSAQIQQALNMLTNGMISFVTLGLNASSYINWGTARQASGYGIRDNAGAIEAKNSGGSWVAIAPTGGSAPSGATYITQIPDATLTAEQALSTLSSGIMRVATTTGVVTSLTTSAGIAANISDEVGTGSLVFNDSPTLTTQATLTRTGVGVTPADGAILTNTTAAAAGAQQMSPRLRWTGAGWKTDATAASQAVDWTAELLPVQGAAAPTAQLLYKSQIGGGGYSTKFMLDSSGSAWIGATAPTAPLGTLQLGARAVLGTTYGILDQGSNIYYDGTNLRYIQTAAGTWFYTTTGGAYSLNTVASGTAGNVATLITAITINNNGTTTFGKPIITGGSVPAVANTSANSCGTTAAAIAGNDNTGTIVVGATSGTSCTVTFVIAATTRRQCVVTNETTANLARATYTDTTHSVFAGVFVAGDVLAYVCSVY